MKVKAKVNKIFGITKNKMYSVSSVDDGCFVVLNDTGHYVRVEISDFHKWPENNDTPQIEVGSEWVNKAGLTGEITAIGKDSVLIMVDGYEARWTKGGLVSEFKPKPKTVTMYFYTDCKGLTHAYSEPMPVFGDYLFTRKIEL